MYHSWDSHFEDGWMASEQKHPVVKRPYPLSHTPSPSGLLRAVGLEYTDHSRAWRATAISMTIQMGACRK